MGDVCPSAPNAVERRASANAFFSLFFVMTALPRVFERVPKWQKASAATPSTQLGAGSETLETSRTRCCKFLCSLGKTTQLPSPNTTVSSPFRQMGSCKCPTQLGWHYSRQATIPVANLNLGAPNEGTRPK